jgi:serine/threonine protein kinase
MEATSTGGSRQSFERSDRNASGAPEQCRTRDPIDQLAEEFVARYRRGERPAVSEYAARFPELADQIQEVLQALVLLEDLAPGKAKETPGEGQVPLRQLGEFRILREVGRGGMGVVYEAVQESLGRHVALKVLPSQGLFGSSHLERFRREARAAAALHHSNIVPVFGVGEEGGVHYYAMQFIHGQSLDQVLLEIRRLRAADEGQKAATEVDGTPADGGIARSLFTNQFSLTPASAAGDSTSIEHASGSTGAPATESQLSAKSDSVFVYFRSVAQIGMQTAEALAYAHGQGVLHRDIKPSNLLLDMQGTVWVTDFGLAKTDATEALTHTGDLVGTLRYMAPERFSGWSDPRSDVYSLGLTLYELLTQHPAFVDADRAHLIKAVMQDDPPRPRKLEPRIPRDLETIVLKATAKEPSGRYQAATELAEDLRCFLSGRPIRARRTSHWEHFRLWCRRNPALATASALACALLIGGLVAVGWQWQRAEHERKAAEAHFQKAREAVDECFTTVTENAALQEPGMEEARKVLLQAALKYYRDFLNYQGDDPSLQDDLARAYYRTGYIIRRIGSPAEAAEALEKACSLYQTLVERQPSESSFRNALADAHF